MPSRQSATDPDHLITKIVILGILSFVAGLSDDVY